MKVDFRKFSEAGRDIKLTEEQKKEIINVCSNFKTETDRRNPISPNFKRMVAVFCALIVAVTAGALYKNFKNTDDIPVQGNTELSTTEHSEIKTTSDLQTTQKPETQTIEDTGCGEILPRKYRNNYYQIPAFFAEIVDRNIFLTWEKEYYLNNYPDDTNVMVMVDFVKEFDISKENFEKANLEYARFIDETYSHICLDPQDYADQEMQEIYNADIIYTFDNELINKYYLGIDYPFLNEYEYVEAMEAGTYETRTTQFIDLDQMEAEIIAKYGEAEIVPEPATLPEETEATA